MTIVARANNPSLDGSDRHGNAYVTGKLFRDEFVTGAIQNGTVRVGYVYSNPVEPGLPGSDG